MPRPNLLFITTDQQRWDSLPCYMIHNLAGHPEMIAVETRMRGHLLDHGFQNQRSLAAEVAVPQHPYRVGGRVCAAAACYLSEALS